MAQLPGLQASENGEAPSPAALAGRLERWAGAGSLVRLGVTAYRENGTDGADLVPKVAKKRTVRAALNNSFGFGGTNASLIMKRV